METAEIFLPVFWVAFAPIVVIVLAAVRVLLSLSNLRVLISVQ
jgi:hypothetical protein